MDGLMGSLLPTCDPHHCEMHSSPLQMSQDPEGVRDLSKVTKQKMAESEPLRPLLRAFMPTCPLSRFILLPPLSSSPTPPPSPVPVTRAPFSHLPCSGNLSSSTLLGCLKRKCGGGGIVV